MTQQEPQPKKRQRATQAEKEERIQYVLECLLLSSSTPVMIQSLIQKYGIERRMAFEYLKLAKERLGSLMQGEVLTHLGLVMNRANYLYTQCVNGSQHPRATTDAISALKLCADVAIQYQKMSILNTGETTHDTVANNPLLARIIDSNPDVK